MNHMRIMTGEVVLLERDYTIRIKHSCRGHNYILQNVLIWKAVQVTFYTTDHTGAFQLHR
jgi:hypothetical protein